MAVVSCTLKRTGRTGRFYVDSKGGIAGDINVEWQVITDLQTDGPVTVYTEALESSPDALPPLFTKYDIGGEVDPGLFLMSVSPTQNEAKLTQWSVSGSYTNLPFGVTQTDAQANPILRPWKYRLEFDTISEAITQGVNLEELSPLGQGTRAVGTYGPIVNTAGQEFGEVHEEPRTRLIYIGSRNFATLDEIYAIGIGYADSINSEIFAGYPQYYCEFLGISSSDLINENGIEYYQGMVRIALNQKPVQINPLNTGWKSWASETELTNVTDKDNRAVSEPIFLSSEGTDPFKVVPGVIPTIQNTVSYRTREKILDFNNIFVAPTP